MKKIVLLFVLITLGLTTKAQITLEHTYDSASVWNTCMGNGEQLLIVNFEVSGDRYLKINRCGSAINIFDMNHTLVKNISLAELPVSSDGILGYILYPSEHLFNLDDKMEFMYMVQQGEFYVTNVYNEEGTLLFTDNSAPFVVQTIPAFQYPIYNTSHGTKMILSCENGQAKVFSLPGTLTTAIATATNSSLESARSFISNPYPNPTNHSTTIDYTLPEGINQGEIVLYTIEGMEIKRFTVDRTVNSLLLSTVEIAAGTYYYQLQTGSATSTSAGRKLVVIR